jgi:hypothetical protein
MRETDQSTNTTLSKTEFRTLCNEVATEVPEIFGRKVWGQNPQMEKKTALLQHLLSKVQTKLGFFPTGFPAHEGKTPKETAYFSSFTNICNVLTHFGKVAINYDCEGTITEELFNRVKELE